MTEGLVTAAYIGSAILFILALGGLSHPERARRGNLYGMVGMALAVIATILGKVTDNYALLLGALVALTGLRLPPVLLDPVTALGQAAVPMILLAFGMSLSGRWLLKAGPGRAPTLTAVTLKVLVMPLTALLLGLALGLSRDATYAVTVLAALPTAQNIFLYAQRFRTAEVLIRDAIFLSTAACLPVMLVIAFAFSF